MGEKFLVLYEGPIDGIGALNESSFWKGKRRPSGGSSWSPSSKYKESS